MESKKYYWLKLKKDFFKRHDITIVEGMENGKDYILFYLKLLVESLDHEGKLRFSDSIPYNESMLARLTHTNVDVVRAAMKVFGELQMIEIMDDETIFMSEVAKMTGSETVFAEKKREYRLNHSKNGGHCLDIVETEKDKVRQEIRDKSIDNNICSAEAEKDDQIYSDFEKIYALYPKKGTKASAFESYKKWVQKSGRKVNGKTYHFTNKQIWLAVKKYVDTQSAKDTQLEYYKNFVTLMNQIYDWVGEDDE